MGFTCLGILFLFGFLSLGPQSNTQGVSESINTTCLECSGELRDIAVELTQNSKLRDPLVLNQAFTTLAPIVDGANVFQSFENQLKIFEQVINHSSNGAPLGYASGDIAMEEAGTWLSIYGLHANQRTRDVIQGYKSDTKGFVLGHEWDITDGLSLGLALSWADLDIHHQITTGSKTDANSYTAIVYSHYDFCPTLFMNLNFAFAYNSYNTHREIIFGDLLFFPDASYKALQSGVELDFGYDYRFHDYHIIPMLQFFYSHLNMGKYEESGAGTANQVIESEDFGTFLGSVGVQFAYDWWCGKSLIVPEVHAKIFYDFLDERMQTTSTFVGSFAPQFNTYGPRPSRDSYNLGASISTPIYRDGLRLSINYDYRVKKDYHDYSGYAQLQYTW